MEKSYICYLDSIHCCYLQRAPSDMYRSMYTSKNMCTNLNILTGFILTGKQSYLLHILWKNMCQVLFTVYGSSPAHIPGGQGLKKYWIAKIQITKMVSSMCGGKVTCQQYPGCKVCEVVGQASGGPVVRLCKSLKMADVSLKLRQNLNSAKQRKKLNENKKQYIEMCEYRVHGKSFCNGVVHFADVIVFLMFV